MGEFIYTNLNLQVFAGEPADLNIQTSDKAEIAPEFKTYYAKQMLENARPNMVHSQFAEKKPIPAHGGKTIEMRRILPFKKALTPLKEAVTPKGGDFQIEATTATVNQYGTYVTISDIVQTTALDPLLTEISKEQGVQAGLTLDTLTRDELHGGLNVLYANHVDPSTGVETIITERQQLDENCRISNESLIDAAAILKAANVSPINGSYVGIVHPYTEAELLKNKDFISVIVYGRPEDMYDGEIGKMAGIRFIRASEAKIFVGDNLTETLRSLTVKSASTGTTVSVNEAITDVEATALAGRDISIGSKVYSIVSAVAGAVGAAKMTLDQAATVAIGDAIIPGEGGKNGSAVFSTLVLGAKGYAETNIDGLTLKFIIKDLGEGNDPLNQWRTLGWKGTHVAKRLNEAAIIRIEHGVKGKSSQIKTPN